MGTLWAITIYTLLVGTTSFNIPARTKTTQPTPTISFTTRTFPTFIPEIKEEEEWMSPPLYNINRTKADLWDGPKREYFRVNCKQNVYRCRIMKQFKLLRSQVTKIKILFEEIYLRFIRAIDSTGYHPTSGRKKSSKGSQLKHSPTPRNTYTDEQISRLDNEDAKMLLDGITMAKYLLKGSTLTNRTSKGNEPYVTNDGKIVLESKPDFHSTQTSNRVKRFILTSMILGWKIHKNKQEIKELRGHINNLYSQNMLQEAQIFELAHFLNTTYGYVAENRLAIYELNTHLMRINKTLMGVISKIKFVKYSIAIVTDARSSVSRMMMGLITLHQNVDAVYEFMRVLAVYKINSVMIPPHSL